MSSSTSRDILNSLKEEDIEMEKINDMSPVTNLALNMKSLTTSLTGTPSRRISWSNPYACDASSKFFAEISPSTDSPTFQEVSCRMKNKFKIRKPSRKVLPSDSEDEKENIAPCLRANSDNLKHPSESSSSTFECSSQDSGFSDLSVKRFQISNLGSTPRIRVKSSIFVDDDEDGFENLYQMDEDQDDKELIPMPDMTNLLTKPLHTEPRYPPDSFTKQGKLPIRRCLSMEMECSPESYHKLQIISKTGTVVASSAVHNPISACAESFQKCTFKRPDPPSTCFSIQNKRRKSSPSVHLSNELPEKNDFTFQRSFSETAATIMHAVQKADLIPDLIGDCSKCYALPLVRGRHQDLKCISSQTLIQLIKGEFGHEIDSYTLVDCRYPYEFEGGHIQGALNIYTKEDILETFLKNTSMPTSGKNVIIFHCEFSSERAPSLCRFLRNKDREMNESYYPKLHHPEIYILNGGYKAFFASFKEYCEPQDYKPMNHKDHGFELKYFRAKSKSWGADSKSRYKLKSSSISEVL